MHILSPQLAPVCVVKTIHGGSKKRHKRYVLSLSMAENVFMGGAMVTDAHALPIEFRYTEPVRATKLQRVLYGDVLEKYIQCDVIAGNLVGRLEQKPDLLIVSDANLLPALDNGKFKVVMISPDSGPIRSRNTARNRTSATSSFTCN